MTRIVDCKHANKAIVAQLEPCDAAIAGGDPDGFEFRRIESAHQVQREDADRSGVTEDRDLATSMLVDDRVEFFSRSIE